MKVNLQLFGGRGQSGRDLGDGDNGGGNTPVETYDLISQREEKQSEVDSVLEALRNVNDEYGYQVTQAEVAKMPAGSSAMAVYYDDKVAISENYFKTEAMGKAYDRCVENGFHPSRGNKTAMEAVTAHELGHALTDKAVSKLKAKDLDDAARKIMDEATKNLKYKGSLAVAQKISGDAKDSNAECIAEAFADVYCNGKNANKESIEIKRVLDKYTK